MISIDIVSDTVCPWCFVGKRRLEQALAQMGDAPEVGIVWRPFQLNPDMPREGADRKTHLRAKFGGDERLNQVYDAIVEAGRAVEIPFAFDNIERTPNTINSHRLIDRAGKTGRQDAVVEALFHSYFLEGRDIGDIDVLADVATGAGLNGDEIRAYLESEEDIERVRAEDTMVREMGVQGVPCFIINHKYAISGAQEPATFLQIFERIAEESSQAKAEDATA
jgi:predicted DsbA family dithiol-disulfide isomerase